MNQLSPSTRNRPPLWVAMYIAYQKYTHEKWRLSSALMIRAIRDWLVLELVEPGPKSNSDAWAIYEERKALRALLTKEADRAEKGDLT